MISCTLVNDTVAKTTDGDPEFNGKWVESKISEKLIFIHVVIVCIQIKTNAYINLSLFIAHISFMCLILSVLSHSKLQISQISL